MSVRLLAVGPHPDDVEYGCGGLLARLSGTTVKGHIVTFPPAAPDGRPTAQAETRMAEARAAAEVLGAGFTALPAVLPERDRVTALLCDVIHAVRPDFVVTVDPHDSHPWHRLVGEATADAVFTAQSPEVVDDAEPNPGPPQLLYMSAYTSVDFRPDVYVDVTAHYPRALRALRCHVTGLRVTPMLAHQMRSAHQWAGCRAAVQLAEGFRLSHRFGQDWCGRRALTYDLLGGST